MTQAGAARLGQGTLPSWTAGEGVLFVDEADGQLYFRRADTGATVGPLGAPPAATIGVQHHLLTGTNIVVAPLFEYLVQGPLTIDEGASLTLDGEDARLSVI